MRRILTIVLGLAIASQVVLPIAPLLPERCARADNAADAKDLFARGHEQRDAGDCRGAVETFRKAYALYPEGLGSLRNIAECEELEGLWASSRRDWLDLKRAALVSKDAKYDGWDAEADVAAARLAPKVAKLTIALSRKGKDDVDEPLDAKAKVTVLVNGELFDLRLLGTELDRDPGSYTLRVEGGKEPVEQRVTLATGQVTTARIVIELDGPAKDAGETADANDGEGTVDVSSRVYESKGHVENRTARAIGWASMGIGAAAAIGVIASVAVRQSALSSLESKCPSYATSTCRSNVSADVSRGRTASILADVFGVVTIVGLGVGVAMVLANPIAPAEVTTKPVSSSLRVTPLAGATFAGAALTGAF